MQDGAFRGSEDNLTPEPKHLHQVAVQLEQRRHSQISAFLELQELVRGHASGQANILVFLFFLLLYFQLHHLEKTVFFRLLDLIN